MRELRPGVWHWTAPHPDWDDEQWWPEIVSSYAMQLGDDFVLFDPLAVPDGQDVAGSSGAPHAGTRSYGGVLPARGLCVARSRGAGARTGIAVKNNVVAVSGALCCAPSAFAIEPAATPIAKRQVPGCMLA